MYQFDVSSILKKPVRNPHRKIVSTDLDRETTAKLDFLANKSERSRAQIICFVLETFVSDAEGQGFLKGFVYNGGKVNEKNT